MAANIPRRLGLRKPTKPKVDWSHPINRGLVACWPITPNAAGAPLIQDIAGQRHFTTSSGGISDAKFGGTTIKYNGSTQFSSAPAAKDQMSNLAQVTISFWINHFSAQIGRVFTYATGGFRLTVSNTDTMAFLHSFGTTNLSRTTSNSTLSENVWHHVVCTWPGGLTAANCHIYIDGVEPSYSSSIDGVGASVDDSGGAIFFGASSAVPANVFNGALENVRIYNRVISASEIQRLFREPWAGIIDRSEAIFYHKGGSAPVSYTLAANPGSYLISGVATGLAAARKLSATAGSYAVTGAAAGLTAQRKLGAVAGVYVITGAAAGLTATRKLSLAPGSYTITGFAAQVGAQRKLNANAGSYFVTGAAASTTTIRHYVLQADPGSYFIQGAGTNLIYSGAPLNISDEYVVRARRTERR